MTTTLSKRLCLTAMLTLGAIVYTTSALAGNQPTGDRIRRHGPKPSTRLDGKEQWNDTRSLRTKVNKRVEKEWDKTDVAFDARG